FALRRWAEGVRRGLSGGADAGRQPSAHVRSVPIALRAAGGGGDTPVTGRPGTRWAGAWLFFVQAEDGIRDLYVTGVQTCALPISKWDVSGIETNGYDGHYLIIANHVSWVDIFVLFRAFHERAAFIRFFLKHELIWFPIVGQGRSEERRVGKEWRGRRAV